MTARRHIVWGITALAWVASCDDATTSTSSVQPSGTPDPRSEGQAEAGSAEGGGPGTDDDSGAGRDAAPADGGSGDSGNAGATCGGPVARPSGLQKIVVNGKEREYLIDVPASVDGKTPVPIIMGFHGGSGTAGEARSLMQLAGTEPALYVYPQAPFWPEAGGVAWNVDPDGVDFPFVDALLAKLDTQYCVDKARIFATGKSNGAFFVNALGCYRSNVIRAFASVAGGGPQTYTCPKAIAAMHVHGTADTAVKPQQGRDSRDYWRQRNGCGTDASAVDPPPRIGYAGCAQPVLWCEHSGGHDWPTWATAGIRNFFLSR